MRTKRAIRRKSSARRASQGAAAVELALVSLPMVIFLMGVFEIGFMLSRYHGISKRVYESARYLSAPAMGLEFSTMKAKAQAIVLHGNPAADVDAASALGIAKSSVIVCRWPDETSNTACPASTSDETAVGVRTVSVSVSSYAYSPIFPGLNYFSIEFPLIRATMPRLQ